MEKKDDYAMCVQIWFSGLMVLHTVFLDSLLQGME